MNFFVEEGLIPYALYQTRDTLVCEDVLVLAYAFSVVAYLLRQVFVGTTFNKFETTIHRCLFVALVINILHLPRRAAFAVRDRRRSGPRHPRRLQRTKHPRRILS